MVQVAFRIAANAPSMTGRYLDWRRKSHDIDLDIDLNLDIEMCVFCKLFRWLLGVSQKFT